MVRSRVGGTTNAEVDDERKGAVTSKIKHAIKLKTSPTRQLIVAALISISF